jgi:hypothetical protein
MGEGGIYDQLGGGFARYSVDAQWEIPHFEKMLYDNGALLATYAQAALATGEAFYRDVAVGIAEWAMREMQSPEGGYYSSFDADSEGHEGKFYVWERAEVEAALSAEEYRVFAPRFGLDQAANFEGEWHLRILKSIEEIAASAGATTADVAARLKRASAKLLAIRAKRVWPARDEKILVSWNALMIRGMAIAARALGRADFAAAAQRALQFIRDHMWRDGRLFATYKDGRAHLNAYLDDYVYLADAVLELLQVRFAAEELAFARELLDVALKHFEDRSGGGFFFTSDDHEALMHRSKILSDDATPAGNGVAAFALVRMGYLVGETRYLDSAERTVRAAWEALQRHPEAHATLLLALEEILNPTQIVVLRGAPEALEEWQNALAKLYAPRRLVFAIPAGATGLPAVLAAKQPRGVASAYLCRGTTCSSPIDSLDVLTEHLGERAGDVGQVAGA